MTYISLFRVVPKCDEDNLGFCFNRSDNPNRTLGGAQSKIFGHIPSGVFN